MCEKECQISITPISWLSYSQVIQTNETELIQELITNKAEAA